MSRPSAGPAGACQPREDGALLGDATTGLALTGPRLLAHADRYGVHDLFVWGGARIGGARLMPAVPDAAEAVVEPGRLRFAWPGGEVRIDALQDLPAMLVSTRGSGLGLTPQRVRNGPEGLEDASAEYRRAGDGWWIEAPWAAMRAWAPGAQWEGGTLRLPAGEAQVWLIAGQDRDEVRTALARIKEEPGAPGRRHDAWIAGLRDRFEVDDPLLRSMVVHGLANAEVSRKELAGGVFAGHAAGHAYAQPARSYYRDAYWTLQALLPIRPERALEQVRLLARGIEKDGRAPSAVITTSPVGMNGWRARRAADPGLASDHPRDDAWWPDHVDSPSLFVLLANDAVAWSGRPEALDETVDGATVRERVGWVADGIVRRCDERGLPLKPLHDRDWADNVFRGGVVGYDVGLAYGALMAAARLLRDQQEAAGAWRSAAERMREAASAVLWDPGRGCFHEFVTTEGRDPETVAIDTLTLLRYGVADEARARTTLETVRRRLETRNDSTQAHGDWGVSCLRPGHPSWVRRRAKARFPLRYHEGAEWPYWSAVYAEQALRRGLDGWRYPLTRWWEVGLAAGRTTPGEYHSPPWPAGSRATGWSSMPVAAALLAGYGLTPDGRPVRPPWGDSVLRDVRVGGRPATLVTRGHSLEVQRHDPG